MTPEHRAFADGGRPCSHAHRARRLAATADPLPCASCLEIDGFPKSCVQLDLQLRHFFADGAHLLLEFPDLLLYPCRRQAEQFLRLRERKVEEGLPNLVSARGSACGSRGPASPHVGAGTHGTVSSSSASSSSLVMSSSSSFSFCGHGLAGRSSFISARRPAHVLGLQLVLDRQLVLVQAAELVDPVLVLAANLDLVAHGLLLLLRQLWKLTVGGIPNAPQLSTYHAPAHHLALAPVGSGIRRRYSFQVTTTVLQ